MKMLVATPQTQGERSTDYHWAVEGELVRIDSACRSDLDDPDGGCGCGRGFAGMSSARATTTALVVDLPMTRHDYVEALRSSLQYQGYSVDPDLVIGEAEGLIGCAAGFVVGAVIERRLWELRVRMLPPGLGDAA